MIDPVSIIVTALATGAAAGLKPTAEQVIKDAYAGFKTLIQRKYNSVDISSLEKKPGSETKRASVAEDLVDAGAADDIELLDQAKILIDIVEQHDRATAMTVGIDLEEVNAAYLTVRRVVSEGTGVKVRKGDFSGGIEINDLRAGKAGGPHENP